VADQPDADDTPRTPDIQHVGRDATSPIVRLVESAPDPVDVELARRLRLGPGDPYMILARLMKAIEKREADSDNRLEDQLGAAIKSQDATLVMLRGEVTELKRTASMASWFVKGILATVSLFAVYVLERVVTRVEREGEQTIQMQWIKARLDKLEVTPAAPPRP
jgi:hypothetical protein